jgi:DNA mismatch repair protein MutL
VAQLWSSYILAEGPTGLVIVDQHLAHERILFDRMLAGAGISDAAGGDSCAAATPAQRLAVPVTLTLGHAQAAMAADHLGELTALGFEVEPFGRDAFVVRAVPAFARPGTERALLHEILEELTEGGRERLTARQERLAATAACKAAIKKGERLAREEIQRLLEDLARTSNPHTCPHGCPIAVEISYQELLKRFKRV